MVLLSLRLIAKFIGRKAEWAVNRTIRVDATQTEIATCYHSPADTSFLSRYPTIYDIITTKLS